MFSVPAALTRCLSLHGLFLTWSFLGELFSLTVLIQSTNAHTCAYTHRPWGLLTLAPRHPPELGMSLPSVASCLKASAFGAQGQVHQELEEANGLSLAAGIPCERAGLWLACSGQTPCNLNPSSQQLINYLKQTRCSYKRKLQLLLWTRTDFFLVFS